MQSYTSNHTITSIYSEVHGLETVCLFTLGTSIDYGKCINHLLLDGYLTTHTFTNVVIFTERCRKIVSPAQNPKSHYEIEKFFG